MCGGNAQSGFCRVARGDVAAGKVRAAGIASLFEFV